MDVASGTPEAAAAVKRLRARCRTRKLRFLAISAVTGQGVDVLLKTMASALGRASGGAGARGRKRA
jgi:hypothetical protein